MQSCIKSVFFIPLTSCVHIVIIRLRRQRRSVASTQCVRDVEPWTIQHGCRRVYHRRSALSTSSMDDMGEEPVPTVAACDNAQ